MRRTKVAVLAVLAVAMVPGAALAEGWQAGTSRVRITPDGPMWMAGYSARDHEAEGALHDLWAKGLAVRDPGGTTALLITLDVCGIDRELSGSIRDELAKAHGLDRSRVALSCSHTHSGPVLKANLIGMYPLDEAQRARVMAYSEGFRSKVIAAGAEAMAGLAAAELSWGVGRCGFAVNRRNNDQARAADLREAIALEGPVDHDVPVLKVGGNDGKTRAVVFLYACHCTTLSGYQMSGDYAGFAMIALERRYPGAQAMFLAGCGGDQNPLPRGTVAHAEGYGDELAGAVSRVLDGRLTAIDGRLAARYEEIPLAFAPIPGRDHWDEEARSKDLAHRNRARAMLARLDRGEAIPATYPYPVQVWRLGEDLIWFFLGGEVTVDYALRLKRSLGPERTWVAAYCNDVMAYIPSRKVLGEGGYEGGGAMVYYGLPGPWADDVEDRIIEASRRLLQPALAEPRPALNAP
jgi:hypothetical protein